MFDTFPSYFQCRSLLKILIPIVVVVSPPVWNSKWITTFDPNTEDYHSIVELNLPFFMSISLSKLLFIFYGGWKYKIKWQNYVYLSAYVNTNLNLKMKYKFSVENNFFSQCPASDCECNLVWKTKFYSWWYKSDGKYKLFITYLDIRERNLFY